MRYDIIIFSMPAHHFFHALQHGDSSLFLHQNRSLRAIFRAILPS